MPPHGTTRTGTSRDRRAEVKPLFRSGEEPNPLPCVHTQGASNSAAEHPRSGSIKAQKGDADTAHHHCRSGGLLRLLCFLIYPLSQAQKWSQRISTVGARADERIKNRSCQERADRQANRQRSAFRGPPKPWSLERGLLNADRYRVNRLKPLNSTLTRMRLRRKLLTSSTGV